MIHSHGLELDWNDLADRDAVRQEGLAELRDIEKEENKTGGDTYTPIDPRSKPADSAPLPF